jgi:hypothetical protein
MHRTPKRTPTAFGKGQFAPPNEWNRLCEREGMKSSLLFAAALFLGSPLAVLAQPAEAILSEFAPNPPPVARGNPVQAPLAATVSPIGRNSRARGELIFTPGGDQVMVVGQIRGLQRNKRYEWTLLRSASEVSLGMWTSDARGFILVNTILPRTVLAKFPEGLVGHTVLIKQAPPLDPPPRRRAVSSGEIVDP